jgi:diguanylate cyclase (GGDEF)-like protein
VTLVTLGHSSSALYNGGVGLGITPPKRLLAVCAGLLVCLEAALSLTLQRSYVLTAFGDLSQCLLLILVLLVFLPHTATSDRRTKLFWALMSLGCGIWLLVQILWTYVEVFLRREVPNPFVADMALFLHLVPMMAAVTVQPHLDRNEQNNRLGTIDFVLLLIWWFYLYLFVVIPWQYISPTEALYGRNFNVLYFLEHFVLVASAGVVWRRTTGPWRVLYGNLFGASLLYALISVAADVAIDAKSYYTGSFYDIPLLVSMAWFMWMGLTAPQPISRVESSREVGEKRSAWVSRLAMAAALSLPLLAGWSIYASQAPREVRHFRLLLTLICIVVLGGLRSLKQHQLDVELDHANQELREASLTDVLTEARNRRFFTTTIESDVRHVLRGYSPQASPQNKNRDLIFYLIDVDHFKEVNDHYGHDVGDQVLIEITRRISSAMRYSDELIRWGGEEFLVVSRYTNREEAATLASRVLEAIGGEPFTLKGGQQIHRTCSIGWSVFPWFVRSPEIVNYDRVLQLADRALYEAKNSGRNQAVGMLPIHDLPVPETLNAKASNLAGIMEVHTVRAAGPGLSGVADEARLPSMKALTASDHA